MPEPPKRVSSASSIFSASSASLFGSGENNGMIRNSCSFAKDLGRHVYQKFRSMNARARMRLIILQALVILAFILIIMHSNSGDFYVSVHPTLRVVSTKKALAMANILPLLKFRDWKESPVSQKVKSHKYLSLNVEGFVSNLEMQKEQVSKSSEVLIPESDYHDSYETQYSCPDLAYNGTVQKAQWTKVLEDDLISMRRELIHKDAKNQALAKELQGKDESDWSDEEIIKKRWFRFGGSAVWLESEQCYLVYTRIIYSDTNRRNYPKINLIRGQAFDKDWNEIKGKQIGYKDVNIPTDVEQQIVNLEKELGMSDCKHLKNNAHLYSSCLSDQAEHLLQKERSKANILARYFVTYPTIIEVPFDPSGSFKGPEDPRVILKPNFGNDEDEPLLIFNMLTDSGDRRIHAFFPHRRNDPLVQFTAEGFDLRKVEKNWTPFFHRNTDRIQLSRGYVHIIYKFSPLEILKCSLNDGRCELVFKGSALELDEDYQFDGMRGGSQFVPLPSILPEVRNKQIWLGFPKLHIRDCGCGGHFYRPMLSLLVESNGIYHQELIVPVIDFDHEILSWDLKGSYCGGNNILSVNSISSWEVVGQNPATKEIEDYLTLTLSEADALSRVMVVKNLLSYVLGIYREKPIKEDFAVVKGANEILMQTLKCLKNKSKEECKAYGERHPEPHR